jgi:hypothetical protein
MFSVSAKSHQYFAFAGLDDQPSSRRKRRQTERSKFELIYKSELKIAKSLTIFNDVALFGV